MSGSTRPPQRGVSKTLAYCAYLHHDGLQLPASGVSGCPVEVMAQGNLRVAWSEVVWPFAGQDLQQSAVGFHAVVERIFQQTAVSPFQLLTVFETRDALTEFAQQYAAAIVADLERLRGFVQMECVLYVVGTRAAAEGDTPRARPHHDAGALVRLSEHAGEVCQALEPVAREVKVHAEASSRRIFALVERGQEQRFADAVQEPALPALVYRRFKGPRPAAEFCRIRLRAAGISEGP